MCPKARKSPSQLDTAPSRTGNCEPWGSHCDGPECSQVPLVNFFGDSCEGSSVGDLVTITREPLRSHCQHLLGRAAKGAEVKGHNYPKALSPISTSGMGLSPEIASGTLSQLPMKVSQSHFNVENNPVEMVTWKSLRGELSQWSPEGSQSHFNRI